MLSCTDENTAVAVEVIPGQASEAPRLESMLDASLQRIEVIDELTADKAFDGDAQRDACVKRDVFPNIPSRSNRVEEQPFDAEGYRQRNRIERLFGKLKQFRRVATRYDKLKKTFIGMIHLALGFIRLRNRVNESSVNRA